MTLLEREYATLLAEIDAAATLEMHNELILGSTYADSSYAIARILYRGRPVSSRKRYIQLSSCKISLCARRFWMS